MREASSILLSSQGPRAAPCPSFPLHYTRTNFLSLALMKQFTLLWGALLISHFSNKNIPRPTKGARERIFTKSNKLPRHTIAPSQLPRHRRRCRRHPRRRHLLLRSCHLPLAIYCRQLLLWNLDSVMPSDLKAWSASPGFGIRKKVFPLVRWVKVGTQFLVETGRPIYQMSKYCLDSWICGSRSVKPGTIHHPHPPKLSPQNSLFSFMFFILTGFGL